MKRYVQLVILIIKIYELNSYEGFGYPCNKEITLCGLEPDDHIMCKLYDHPLKNCTGFQLFRMTRDLQTRIVVAHNGFRHKVASMKLYEIPNMNQLVWDDSLGEMAHQYIFRCNTQGPPDECHYIGDRNHTIGQNYYYSSRFPGYKYWLAHAINSWLDFSATDKTQLVYVHNKTEYSPYTQFMWPTTKQLGCAGARVTGGVLFVCYYGPKGNEGPIYKAFSYGKVCSKCPIGSFCSKAFTSLCNGAINIGFIANQPKLSWILFVMFLSCVINNNK